MRTYPGILDQGYMSSSREADRELMLSLAMSDLAVMTVPDGGKKTMDVKVEHVAWSVDYPARARELARAINGGADLPHVVLQLFTLQHFKCYIVIDGNHRCAAYAYMMLPKIRADIVSSTDVTDVDFRLDSKGRVCVEMEDGSWKILDYKIETEIQKAHFQVTHDMRGYDKVRRELSIGWPFNAKG